MQTDETDRLVAATLAAAKASAANLTKPIEWILEYERMLKVLQRRRKEQLGTEDAQSPPAETPDEPVADVAAAGPRSRKRKPHADSPAPE